MAAPTKEQVVEVRKTDAGDFELGTEIDGAWVAFGHKDAGYVEGRVAAAKEAAANDK